MTSLRARAALAAYGWTGLAAYPAVSAFVMLRAARAQVRALRLSQCGPSGRAALG